jgi:hypothetical protein
MDRSSSCLRSALYIDRLRSAPAAERETLLQKARATLSAAGTGGTGLFGRRALATLASLDYDEVTRSTSRDLEGRC